MEQSKPNIPKPSEIMRVKRPYLYSDSENTNAYRLGQSELSHQLDSLTDRNQHKDFETFARKVCEREICPNLRPQTGPEGGGDGKVDTETYPVDEKISERWFVGDGSSSRQKWAFAFSAKKTWSGKVRSDVQGIIDTNRGYERVFFVTSRPTRAKVRLRIEDELAIQHGVPVTILDREWLIDRVFLHNHQDLAFAHLDAGSHEPDAVKLGPNDFARQQALDEIEDRLSKSGSEPSDQTQAISDTFEAASLSRRLEQPHYETEGRFLRAAEFAKKYGANYQLLRAVYERAWTRFWWFDDIDGMQELYEEVEEIAFETDHAHHISKVCNLYQLIVGQVVSGQKSAGALALETRAKRLKTKLSDLAGDKLRPNNALYAETLLLFHALNEKVLAGEQDNFGDTWLGLSKVIDKAHGMGEFPADLLDLMIEALMSFAPESEAFDALIEKLAEFMAERDKERKAGQIYFKQGERKLDSEKPIDAIKYLGRAVVNFMKEESREEQSNALYYLSVAYRGAGLLWAARGAAMAAITQISALSEQDVEIRVETIPSFVLFTGVSLQLGHVADFLCGMQFLHTLNTLLPLEDDSQTRLQKELVEFDQLFACLLIGLPNQQIQRLVEVPDILKKLHLFTARTALLYRLGHIDVLRNDGSIPEDTDEEEIRDMMVTMASQPACRDLPKEIILLDGDFSSVKTRVMGVEVRIKVPSNQNGVLLAEAHVSFLEAFISTLLNSGAYPHRENLEVEILQSGEAKDATAEFIAESSTILVSIPTEWDMTTFDEHANFVDHLVMFGAVTLANTLMLRDHSEILEELIGIERAFERATLFCRSGISRHRSLGQHVGKISDWNYWIERSYNLLEDAPVLTPENLSQRLDDESSATELFGELNSHSDLVVSSIINQQLWDAAEWQGMLYGYAASDQPPFLGLMFASEEKGRAIFQEWRRRFGERDTSDEIRVIIVKGIDRDNPFHYRGCISRDLDAISKDESGQFIIVNRSTTMTVSDHKNLDMFLKNLATVGCYVLLPAVVSTDGHPKLISDVAILKRKFHVRDAWQIGCHDVDAMAIGSEDEVVIPDGESNPPINELFEWRRQMGAKKKGEV